MGSVGASPEILMNVVLADFSSNHGWGTSLKAVFDGLKCVPG